MAASQAATAAAQRNYRSLASFPTLNLALAHATGSSSAPTLNGGTSDTFADIGDTLDLGGIGAGGAGVFVAWIVRSTGSAAPSITVHGTYTDAGGTVRKF